MSFELLLGYVSHHFAGSAAANGVPDMTVISNIDVNGINENLRVRYKRDEIYTFAGTILVAVNPYKFLPIYEDVWKTFVSLISLLISHAGNSEEVPRSAHRYPSSARFRNCRGSLPQHQVERNQPILHY